jgi:hypothetical protein
MKDFNIAKYLKENHLGSHGILGRYVDLHGLKEDKDLGQQEAMPEPYEGDGHPIDGLGGKLNRHMDVSMNEEDMEEADMNFNDEIASLSIEYKNWLEKNNLPIMSADELLSDYSIEKTDEQKAWLQTFIDRWDDAQNADDIDEEVSVSSSGVEMEEDWSEEQDKYDRMMGLSHEYFEKVSPIVRYTIDKLRADGFDDQDILDFMATDFS